MQQIKVKELPKDWFISTTHYQSGNKEFIKKGKYFCEKCKSSGRNQYDISKNGFCRYSLCLTDDFVYSVETTHINKHIQLVAANPSLKGNHLAWLDDGEYAYDGLMAETVGLKPKTKEEVRNWKIQGKDFFVYEVSEVK